MEQAPLTTNKGRLGRLSAILYSSWGVEFGEESSWNSARD